jgi:2',3'-cyclic-nucleotide 2'-phosphodiesterase (5'-nucleotidase family)
LKKLHLYLSFLLLIILFACSSNIKYVTENSSISIDTTLTSYESATKLINPYKLALDSEMNEVLVISAEEFPKEKGKSETKLGNLVADLSLEVATEIYGDSIDFCLLNFGGLRTSLPKGEITKGKIFELMPFENELVVLTLNKDSLKSLIHYLNNVGGQPISGNISFKFSGKEFILDENLFPNNYVKILTSDYLAGGGDKMNFFLNPIKTEKVGIKLRDAIIQYCIQENAKGNQLTGKLDGRITFE